MVSQKKFVQNVKNLFYKANEEDKDPFKNLMIYHNNSLTSSLQSQMQTLQSRSARSDLPMSKVARKQLCLDSELRRNKHKHEQLPPHDLHVGQDVMFQDATSKQWFLANITSLCSQSRSYRVTTREGVNYRKTQAHLMPTYHKARRLKINILYGNLMIWGHLNLIARSLIQLRIRKILFKTKRDIKPSVKLDL